MNQCIECGGTMVGDGYTSVMHCEYADETEYEYHEADANPVYCDFKELEEHKADLNAVTTWHKNAITIDDNGIITAWDESGANVVNSDCSTVAKAIVILDLYALTLVDIADVNFDYDKQEYMLNGKELVNTPSGWDFPCPKCQSPAHMNSCDAHGEYHTCLNRDCGHSFTVK